MWMWDGELEECISMRKFVHIMCKCLQSCEQLSLFLKQNAISSL